MCPSRREYVLIEYFGESYPHTVNTDDCPQLRGQEDQLMECSSDNFCKCEDSRNNSYSCLRSNTRLHCFFYDNEGFLEIYNLYDDPWQMNNLARNERFQKKRNFKILNYLRKCSGLNCQFN